MIRILYIFILLFCLQGHGQYFYPLPKPIESVSKRLDAYLVTAANASSLQSLIDTHDIVRLGPGDYSASGNISLTSGQEIYGWYIPTVLGGTVTISAGSSNVHIESIQATSEIIFEAGDEISDCTLKFISNTRLMLTNGKLVNSTFTDMQRCRPIFDCSTSGYFRNNLFLKMMTQNVWPQSTFIGNDTDLSYGNIELWRNFLFSNGDGGKYENLLSHTILGVDMESWNALDEGSLGGIYVRDVDEFKISNVLAYNNEAYDTTPALDIGADRSLVFTSRIEDNLSNLSVTQEGTNIGTINSKQQILSETEVYNYTINALNALDGEVLVNGVDKTTELTGNDSLGLKELFRRIEGDRIDFENRDYNKSVTGLDWATERIGKTDQSAAIQALIDANGVAELDEGIYYISQPLVIEDEEGIVGKGKWKTAIVGITDDFPLIQDIRDVSGGNVSSVNYVLSDMTLQGGSKGLYVSKTGDNNLQLTFCHFRNLVFKDQNYGMHFEEFYGFDNNFMEGITWENCNIAFYQDPDPGYVGGDTPEMMYVDKTMFYNCEVINCGTGFEMRAARVNNTNAWVNCFFYGNDVNLDMNENWNSFFVNTVFTNTQGSYVVEGNNLDPTGFYNCDIYNNSVDEIFHLKNVHLEDCRITDNVPLLEGGGDRQLLVTNSNITGTLGDVDDGISYNSIFSGNADLSKFLVKISAATPTVLMSEASDPYPEFLKRHDRTPSETVNTYNFTASSHALKYAYQESIGSDLTTDFPTDASFSFMATATNNSQINRHNANSPSDAGSLIGPQTASNYYIYAEGSGALDNASADDYRYSVLMPTSYSRVDGLEMTAKVSVTRITALDVRIRMYYRITGEDETSWILAGVSPSSTGSKEWQDWREKIPPGPDVDILFSIQNDSRISTWPDKAFFDSGLDDILITETD